MKRLNDTQKEDFILGDLKVCPSCGRQELYWQDLAWPDIPFNSKESYIVIQKFYCQGCKQNGHLEYQLKHIVIHENTQ